MNKNIEYSEYQFFHFLIFLKCPTFSNIIWSNIRVDSFLLFFFFDLYFFYYIQKNNNDNSNNSSNYFENNDSKGRKHQKFRDFDNFNNKNSIRTFLSSILEKNPNFSLKSQCPEKLLKIYNCYLSDDSFSFENDFNDRQDTPVTQNMKTESNDESSTNEENSQDDHFSLKKQNCKINILTDIKNENHADAREFLF